MVAAFLLRDFRQEWSYRISFVLQAVGTLHVLLIFLLLSRLFGDAVPARLQSYGGKYFPFVLMGVAIQQYFYLALNTFSGQLREAQLSGTFEAVLACPAPLPVFLAGSTLYAFAINAFQVLVCLGAGYLLGARFPLTQLPLVVLVLALSAAAFAALGILSASYIVIFKKGNPLTWFFTLASTLLGGVYYPVSILPGWAQKLASLLPMTHALEALRAVLLRHAGLWEVAPSLGALGLWVAVGLPLSCLCFAWAVRKGRQNGTLGHY
jgi:ABC-2 type transport system permease protein